MSLAVTYRLPPYVERVSNLHYHGGGVERYAQYKLRDLGAYPMGSYTVTGVNNKFNGTFKAIDSTNTSVTLSYHVNPGVYPAKDLLHREQFMDINRFEFAYRAYDRGNDTWRGISNERQYDPAVFDFDAASGQDTAAYTGIEVIEPIIYTKVINHRVYGYAIIRLDQLPGYTTVPTQDPSGLNLAQMSDLDQIIGRYLVVINDIQNTDGSFTWNIYPTPPANRNLDITFTHLIDENPPDIISTDQYHFPPINDRAGVAFSKPVISGSQIIVRYNSMYAAVTGPGSGRVHPYRSNLISKTKPGLMILPTEALNVTPYRFYYTGGKEPFDLHRNLNYQPTGTLLPYNYAPTNLLKIGAR